MIHAANVDVDMDDGRYTLIVMDKYGEATVIDVHDCVLTLYLSVRSAIGAYAKEAFEAENPQTSTEVLP